MKNQNNNQNIIKPVSQTNAFSGKSNCDQIRKAWISVDGILGDQKRAFKVTAYKLHYQLRFCFEDNLQPFEEGIYCNYLPKSLEEARFDALAIGLSEFIGRVSPDDLDSLQCWKLGIVSAHAEFLTAIKARFLEPIENDYFYGSGNRNPIDNLRSFSAVDLLQIDTKDLPVLYEEENCKIKWN